jgi:hypothetical protein
VRLVVDVLWQGKSPGASSFWFPSFEFRVSELACDGLLLAGWPITAIYPKRLQFEFEIWSSKLETRNQKLF